MKKFSRSLVAIAAAGVLTTSGTSVAGAQYGDVPIAISPFLTHREYMDIYEDDPDSRTVQEVSPPFEASAEHALIDGSFYDLTTEHSTNEEWSELAGSAADVLLSSVENDVSNEWAFGTTYDIIVGILIAVAVGAALVGVAPQLGLELPLLPF